MRTGSSALEPAWRELDGGDLPDVAALAGRCLAVDGGLPLIMEMAFLRDRFAADGGAAWGAAGPDGRLVAAGAVRPQEAAGVRWAVFTGLVEPASRGRGLGAALLDRGLVTAGACAGRVAVETESLTGPAVALFASRGLRRVRAEDVLRRELADDPLAAPALPPGVALAPWPAVSARRFFAVYRAAFRDRPGFPDWPLQRWVDWTSGDEDFRPDWSLLAVDATASDVGFVTCARGWIVQVGVRPEWRGRGLGAALVTEAARRMRGAGATEVHLDVDVDNPAGRLYRRLGFAPVGRRARFEPAG